MTALGPWLALCRVSNLPSVWTNVLAACLLTGADFRLAPVLLLGIALSLFYLGGMSLNDVCDLAYDRRHKAGRPIPAGLVSLAGARALTLVLFAGGWLLLWAAPHRSGAAFAVLLLASIVLYDFWHKGNRYSVLLMAACRALVFAVSAAALVGNVPPAVLVGAAVQFAYVLLISVVARYENARPQPFPLPVIPAMLAGISLVDGIVVALLVAPVWLLAGMVGALATWGGQRFVRGD